MRFNAAVFSICNFLAIIHRAQEIYEAEVNVKNAKAEGKTEEKIQTAKHLLQDGLTIDLISRYTDLSKEQIENLRKYILVETTAVNF